MKESILNFTEQFNFEPEIVNEESLDCNYNNFILGGMGGSSISANLLHIFRPGIKLHIHKDYGLPAFDNEFMSDALFIASSYSGNTEETLDFVESAYSRGYKVAIITSGGKLLEYAKTNNLPYIQIPSTGIQPRMALGFSILSISKFVNKELVPEIQGSLNNIELDLIEKQADEIFPQLENKIPTIYSSLLNQPLGYVWKITLNETGKVPAFQNVFPELNHNEMQSFDFSALDTNENQNKFGNFGFIILHDSEDYPQNELRMKTLETLYQEKGFDVISLYLEGNNPFEKVFKSILLACFIALKLAEAREVDPETVPLIEEFKKRISK